MCTVILLYRPGHPWPVLVAANRDERLDRPWDPPVEYWPGLVGGRDRLAGGTWMAVNRHGVMAAVLNRVGSLGPTAGKRSRGELPLMALAEESADGAARLVAGWDAGVWRPFNLVLADRHGGFFAAGLGEGRPEVTPLPAGLSMITAWPPNDPASARAMRHLPRWRAAPAPESPDDWGAWPGLLADQGGNPAEALNVPPRAGFGTVCASLLGLGAATRWDFAAGPPHLAEFQPVSGLSGPTASPLL
jgi:hypothetical protein